MAADRLLTVADGLVSAIAGGTWTIGSVTPTRRYSTEYSIRDLATLRVDVQPIDQIDNEDDRDEEPGQRTNYVCQVSVQKKVDPSVNAEVDPLLKLTREISDFFKEGKLITIGTELKIEEAKTILYSPKEFDVNKRYFGTVLLKLSEWR